MRYSTTSALVKRLGLAESPGPGAELATALANAHMSDAPKAALGALWSMTGRDYVAITKSEAGASEEGARQSWRSASGKAFEEFVRLAINRKVEQEGLLALGQTQLTSGAPNIVDFLTLPAKRVCTQDNVGVWPDNDLVVVCRRNDRALQAIAVLSCKTSLRERVIQSLFWSLAIKVGIPVKSLLVTLDAQGELGTCDHPTKARRLIEAYFDATYVLNETTSTCQAVRLFDALPRDLIRWRDDLAPSSLREPLEL